MKIWFHQNAQSAAPPIHPRKKRSGCRLQLAGRGRGQCNERYIANTTIQPASRGRRDSKVCSPTDRLVRAITWTRSEVPAPVLASSSLRAGRVVVDVVKVGVGEGALLEGPGGAAEVAHAQAGERPVVAPAAARVRSAVVAGVVAQAEVGGGLDQGGWILEQRQAFPGNIWVQNKSGDPLAPLDH